MKSHLFSKVLAMIIVVMMLVSAIPMNAFAASVDYTAHDDYYKVISKKDYELAPGIVESEIVLNNAAGSHRQVAHVVEVDLSNPYAKVIPSYKGMVPTPGNYGVQIMSQQAAFAEANGYGNVVAAMNLSLSWYNSDYYVAHPELVGEPLGYMVLDGKVYMNSNGQTSGAQTCVVINFDEKDGVARPEDMPKVEIRSTSSAITGWEEQVIPANFGFLVKDGKNQYSKDNNATNGASRSFVGLKEDGTFVMVMNDGRQSPYSAGFTSYEMAEFMLSLGCVVAVNGDGGGSSAFLSQRPGEELKINCSPSDGAERPTTHGILVISTAPATGEFVRANITADADYYTPGSSVKFTALGTDLVGTSAEIPADVTWQLADPSMGTIADGVFVSNGKVGTATAQMVWNGEVVGEASVEIVIPTEFSFSQAVMTVPFDKEVTIGLNATINGGLNSVVLKPEDVTFVTTNSALGTFNGFQFTSVSQENAPADLTSTLTATLVHNTELVATASLSLGKGSEVLFDFEDASDIDGWNIADVNGNDKGFYQNLSFATSENGKVHDGIGSMRVEMNPIAANGISNGGYGQSDLFLDNGVVVENAKSIGFWAYIPDEYEHCWIRVLYWYDPDGDGKFDKKNTVNVILQPEVYNSWDESGWRYFSVDVSAYSKVLIPGRDCKDIIGYNASKNDANNFRFIEFMFPHTNTNDLWKEYGTINGLQTVYIDNITADFSDAVDDREAPVFGSVELAGNDIPTVLEKYVTAVTTSNLLTVSAKVAENTAKTNATGLNNESAKAYVDGVEVPVTFANGKMTISDVAVANGIHRVKFEICDNMGNKSVVIRLVEVKSDVDASTVEVVPADPTLDKLYGGSVYWMNVNANKIETIQSVKAVIDLNYGNHFELDHMVLADGFTATYTIDEENNTATIVITRTGNNTQTGAATLAALPIRVIYYDTDINIDGYTAETFWNEYGFWPYDLKVDVDMGEITYVEGYTSDVLGAFSNEEFSVDTELQTAFSDAAFKEERGTAHVHTSVAVDDLDATCTKNGYTGRTYCEVCDSIVDWGTTVLANGHTYEFVDGVLMCEDGDELFNGVYTDGKTYIDGVVVSGWVENSYYVDGIAVTGIYAVDGVYYDFGDNGVSVGAYSGMFYNNDIGGLTYAINGNLIGGWQYAEDNWHYFDEETFTTVSEKTFTYEYGRQVSYKFNADGTIVSGVWVELDQGTRYYYGPGYYKLTSYQGNVIFFEIDGKTYGFNGMGFRYEGINFCKQTHNPQELMVFTDDGVYVGNYTGMYEGYYYADGYKVPGAGLIEFEGDYYYISTGSKPYVGTIYVTEAKANGLKPANKYTFGSDGKMVIEPVKNGIVDGKYYVNDVVVKNAGVVLVDGDYYYIRSNGTVYVGKISIGEAKANGLVEHGTYTFGSDGKMIIEPTKNGIVDGKYYVDGKLVVNAGVVLVDGDYYYIRSNGTVYVGKISIGEAKANGLVEHGTYTFGSDGKMIIEPAKNGIVDGKYYVDGKLTVNAGVVLVDGNYYYIRSNGTVYVGKISIGEAKANGLIDAGSYTTDATGALIVD